MGTTGGINADSTRPNKFEIAHCIHCKHHSFWQDGKLIYPATSSAPLPHSEMPDEVKIDYNEAREIANKSPRSGAALLRLAVQKLANGIAGVNDDANLNDTIKKLVADGLPQTVQQALDIVRVTGNNAVHPGVIDLRDDDKTVSRLFGLVNIITDYMIAKPREIAEHYGSLPEKDRQNIAKRDGKSSSG
jgi:hypothetical protein